MEVPFSASVQAKDVINGQAWLERGSLHAGNNQDVGKDAPSAPKNSSNDQKMTAILSLLFSVLE